MTPVGETFDDAWGRFRQVSYEATVPDCKDTLVRVSTAAVEGTEMPAQQVWSFSVWPDRQPDFGEYMHFNLEQSVTENTEVTVNAGSTFLVYSSELDHAPNGFAWKEPEHQFACA